MNANTQEATVDAPATSHRTREGHAVSRCRVVHVAVPERVFNHAKAQAYLSGVSWTKFIEHLLSHSTPIQGHPAQSRL